MRARKTWWIVLVYRPAGLALEGVPIGRVSAESAEVALCLAQQMITRRRFDFRVCSLEVKKVEKPGRELRELLGKVFRTYLGKPEPKKRRRRIDKDDTIRHSINP